MREMGIQGICPGPNTSRRRLEHTVSPYLLRGLVIERPNQVWSADITYIRLIRGFAYLVAILDWFSRYVYNHERFHQALDYRTPQEVHGITTADGKLSTYSQRFTKEKEKKKQKKKEKNTTILK